MYFSDGFYSKRFFQKLVREQDTMHQDFPLIKVSEPALC
jgi:hypothetical protein